MIELHQSENNNRDRKKFKAVIVTALGLEYNAIKLFLNEVNEIYINECELVCDKGTILFKESIWEVLLVQSGEHNISAALITKAATSNLKFKPDIALFVGISGRLKDLEIGDVVVSKTIKNYDQGKSAEEYLPRISEVQITDFMQQLSMAITRDGKQWIQRIQLKNDKPPVAKCGIIASGSLLMASTKSPEYSKVKKFCSDALVIEMEGYGFMKAVDKLDALVIRGISDLIDGKNQADASGSQELAAHHAAAFAVEVLSKYGELKSQDTSVFLSSVNVAAISREPKTPEPCLSKNSIDVTPDLKHSSYPSFEIGRLIYPVEFLMGHPSESYNFDDIICSVTENTQKIPNDIEEKKIQLIDEFRQSLPVTASFFNGSTVRIEDWGKINTKKKRNAQMMLLLSRGEYFDSIITNFCLDKKILLGDDNKFFSIREKYANKSVPLKKSILGNLLGFTINVVSNDNKVILTERSDRVALYPELYNTAVSGTIDPELDCDKNGIPNPFISAQREIFEEIGIKVNLNDITFSALIIEYEHCKPELIGEVKIDKNIYEIKKLMRRANLDHFEYERLIDDNIEFTPEIMYPYLKNNKWIPQAAICIIYSLIKKWGDERVEKSFT